MKTKTYVAWVALIVLLLMITCSVVGATSFFGSRVKRGRSLDVCSIPVHLKIEPYVLVRPIKESVTVTVPAGSSRGSYSGDLFFAFANCPAIARIKIVPRTNAIKDVVWDAKVQVDKGDPLDQEIVLPANRGVEILTTVKAEFKDVKSVLAYRAGEHKKQADLVLTIFPAMP